MSLIQTILSGVSDARDGFYSLSLGTQQLCKAGKVKVERRSGLCTVVDEEGVEVITLPDDTVDSGRDAVYVALSRVVSRTTGVQVKSPVDFVGRACKFASKNCLDYLDYVKYVNEGEPASKEIKLAKSEDGELSLSPALVANNTTYIIDDGVADTDVIDIICMVFASTKCAVVSAAKPNPRGLSRILSSVPAACVLADGKDGRIRFGREGPALRGYVPGPESEDTVGVAELALLSVGASESHMLAVLEEAVRRQVGVFKTSKMTTTVGASLGDRSDAQAPPAPCSSAGRYPKYRDLNDAERELLHEIALYGEGVTSRASYLSLDPDAIFGSRQKTGGRSLIKSLAQKIKTWREGADLKSHSLEDMARIIAHILTQDQEVNQSGPGVAHPILGALIVLARSANVYRIHNGCEIRSDGKHYPI